MSLNKDRPKGIRFSFKKCKYGRIQVSQLDQLEKVTSDARDMDLQLLNIIVAAPKHCM